MWAQWVCSVLCDVYMCGLGNVYVCCSYPHDLFNYLPQCLCTLRVYGNVVYGGMLIRFVTGLTLSIVWAIVIARQTRVKPKERPTLRVGNGD